MLKSEGNTKGTHVYFKPRENKLGEGRKIPNENEREKGPSGKEAVAGGGAGNPGRKQRKVRRKETGPRPPPPTQFSQQTFKPPLFF